MDPFTQTKEEITGNQLPRGILGPSRDIFAVMGKTSLKKIKGIAIEVRRRKQSKRSYPK